MNGLLNILNQIKQLVKQLIIIASQVSYEKWLFSFEMTCRRTFFILNRIWRFVDELLWVVTSRFLKNGGFFITNRIKWLVNEAFYDSKSNKTICVKSITFKNWLLLMWHRIVNKLFCHSKSKRTICKQSILNFQL